MRSRGLVPAAFGTFAGFSKEFNAFNAMGSMKARILHQDILI